jgi:hypothetical protein
MAVAEVSASAIIFEGDEVMKNVIESIIKAEEKYGCEHIDVIIDYNNNDEEKVFVMYHDKHNSFAVNTFDYNSSVDEDKIKGLCDDLNLGFDNYL